MRFLIDMPLSPALAQWLVGQGHDGVHAAALNLAHAPDTAVMAHAKSDGRIVITADLDYPRLLALSGADIRPLCDQRASYRIWPKADTGVDQGWKKPTSRPILRSARPFAFSAKLST